jgi:hypothetical protein
MHKLLKKNVVTYLLYSSSGAIPVVCVLNRMIEICRTQLYWNILYLLYSFIQATCFDPLKGSSSGRRSIYKSNKVYAYLLGSRSVSFIFNHLLRWNVWNKEFSYAELVNIVSRLSFIKTSEFWGGFEPTKPPPILRHSTQMLIYDPIGIHSKNAAVYYSYVSPCL